MRRRQPQCQRWSSRDDHKVPCRREHQPNCWKLSVDLIPLLVISNTDHVINTGDKNAPVRRDEFSQEGDKISHGFVHGSTKDARVEVASWTADFGEHVRQTTEAVSDTRSTGVEPIVIRLEVDSVKDAQPPGDIRLTMQTASTPWNQPSFSLPRSAAINSSRPTLPLSSIPSKTKRRFTGSSIPKSLWASRTLSHPRMGPLSSDDPRPMS